MFCLGFTFSVAVEKASDSTIGVVRHVVVASRDFPIKVLREGAFPGPRLAFKTKEIRAIVG